MKYITIILIILAIGYFVFPKPEQVSGQDEEKIDVTDIKVIREYEERTIKDEIQYVFGHNWEIAYAIMMAESRGKSTAKNVNYHSNGSVTTDFGYWQINDYFHPSVTQECAKDVKCSTAYAYELSKGGLDFSAWCGFTNKGYLQFL